MAGVDPGPLREVFVVLVERGGKWTPYDWRTSQASANQLAVRLCSDGLKARVQVNEVASAKPPGRPPAP